MKNSLKLFSLAACAVLGLTLAGCKEKDPMDKAADSVKDAANSAADATKDAADKAAAATKEAAEKVKDEIKK